ncbi:MAG: hypothetical protein GX262_12120 [Clostridia bacterium]|jgi:hypothetical protein|nr:hypothetical protein [Clostridia bacterium]
MKTKFLALVLVVTVGLFLGGCGGHEHDHDHAHGGFEWIGEFELTAGEYLFHFGACEDETMDVGFIKMGDNITDLEHHAAHVMASDKERIPQEGTFEAKPDYAYTLEMDPEHGHIYFTISEDGVYAIVTEHFPGEMDMQVFTQDQEELSPIKEHEGAAHEH